jgi:hypothetical protein
MVEGLIMPRRYDEAFVTDLMKRDPNEVGTALAMACVRAAIPVMYVAFALGVTRMTVYSWFRGKPIRDSNRRKVEAFTELLESDTAKGLLPVAKPADARAYIEALVGREYLPPAVEERLGPAPTPEVVAEQQELF